MINHRNLNTGQIKASKCKDEQGKNFGYSNIKQFQRKG